MVGKRRLIWDFCPASAVVTDNLVTGLFNDNTKLDIVEHAVFSGDIKNARKAGTLACKLFVRTVIGEVNTDNRNHDANNHDH